ncbi:MAG TPA: hypothetical protein VF159_09725 [Gemmatimonadaceae bacterium]
MPPARERAEDITASSAHRTAFSACLDARSACLNACAAHPNACAAHPNACAAHPNACAAHTNARAAHPNARAAHPNACAAHPDTCAAHPNACAAHPNASSADLNASSADLDASSADPAISSDDIEPLSPHCDTRAATTSCPAGDAVHDAADPVEPFAPFNVRSEGCVARHALVDTISSSVYCLCGNPDGLPPRQQPPAVHQATIAGDIDARHAAFGNDPPSRSWLRPTEARSP